ncbi:MAG: NADH-quinone oxidoreductase subunit C [Alphaproteobacteria bacterium]|nr:NADH-quinone oxidoreductase subunit C [Alphaproteobacteria bacterium]OJV12496.1 MAG: NADH-quinone oxidoreductase subunit C [Alphaproteobacteria bacterium 33-17]
MSHSNEELITYINANITCLNDLHIAHDNSVHCRVDSQNILNAICFFKDDEKMQFKTLIDIFCSDFPYKEKRFEVTYQLLSMKYNKRVYIKTSADSDEILDSVSSIFSGAIWYEREVWDMYGVMFNGNPDLRRILTDYGFQGHPLRKDFPLTGYVEVRYDMETKKVVYEPVNLSQEYRSFDFLSPWEGAHYVLPGDEKAKA